VIAPGPHDGATALDAITAPGSRPGEPGSRVGSARVLRVAGPTLPYDRTYHLLGRLDKIRSLVRAERPDILEAHSPYLAAAAVVGSGREAAPVRTAFWHADHLGTYVAPLLDRWVGRRAGRRAIEALHVGVRALLAPFDATFTAGAAQGESLRRAGVPNVFVVPFGVDSRVFRPDARSAEARRRLASPGTDCVLVGVGRFAAEKRWDVVIDAFNRVRARRPAVLALFGDGPERARVERSAPPGVVFPGFVRDRAALAAALASADVLVHGCPCETFGLAVAEAVACGLPVVVPDAGGAVEAADPSCSERYLSGDAEACAMAIERVLARRGPELSRRAAEAAARVPTPERHFRRVLAVYDDLLRDRRARTRGQRFNGTPL